MISAQPSEYINPYGYVRGSTDFTEYTCEFEMKVDIHTIGMDLVGSVESAAQDSVSRSPVTRRNKLIQQKNPSAER